MKDATKKHQPDTLAPLKRRIAELEALVREKDESHKRALADYQNLRKNTQEERGKFAKIATALFIGELLEPLDHLEMAAAHLKDASLDIVVRQFAQALEREGVQEIQALGKPFDPHTMEAVETVDGEKNKVIKVAKKGYTMSGAVLRPAKVVVGNGSA